MSPTPFLQPTWMLQLCSGNGGTVKERTKSMLRSSGESDRGILDLTAHAQTSISCYFLKQFSDLWRRNLREPRTETKTKLIRKQGGGGDTQNGTDVL